MPARLVDAREVTIMEGMSFRDILSLVDDGLWEWNAPNGGKRVGLTHGLDRLEQIIGRGLISPNQLPRLFQALLKARREGIFYEPPKVVDELITEFNKFLKGVRVGMNLRGIGKGRLAE